MTDEQTRIAEDFKIQTIPQTALRLNGRNGIGSDDIINKHLTACFVGGNAGTVVVPEQVYIAAVLLQDKAQLHPSVTGELYCCLAAVRVFKNALIVEALSVDPSVGIKGDHRSCRQLLTEVDAEGRPQIGLVAQPQSVTAAVFRGFDPQFFISGSFKGSIIFLALTGEQQFLTGRLEINALIEVIGYDLRLLSVGKVGADQVVDIQHIRSILTVCLVLQKLNGQIPHAGKIIDGEASHFGQIVGTGRPALCFQGKGLLGSTDIVAVFLAHIDAGLDMQLLLRSIVHIKGNAAEFGKVAGSTGCIQEIQLDIRMRRRLIIVALNRQLHRAAALGKILGIGIDLHSAKHFAHSQLCACDLLIGFKAQQLHKGFLLLRNGGFRSFLFFTAA